MTIELNQFAPNEPLAGLYVYMANLPQLHTVLVSASQSAALKAGDIVKLDTSSTNTNSPVVVKAGVSDDVFGIVTYNPVKNQFAAGERVAVARPNDIVWMPASAAVSVGDTLHFNTSCQVASTGTGTSTIGKALTKAAASGDFVQVELAFNSNQAST